MDEKEVLKAVCELVCEHLDMPLRGCKEKH